MDTIALIGAFEQVAAKALKRPEFVLGTALTAAQHVFAKSTEGAEQK
jgi:hypothetical protein